MSRFINNTNAVLGITWTEIGLFLASGILLTAIISALFFNDWYKTAELNEISNKFSLMLEGTDTQFYENCSIFYYSDTHYPYTITLSTQYLVLTTNSLFGGSLSVTTELVIKPWPRTENQPWYSHDNFHNYLNTTFGHYGTDEDPLNITIFQQVFQEWNTTRETLALHPLTLLVNEPVYIDKVILYYDHVHHQDFLLIYQT